MIGEGTIRAIQKEALRQDAKWGVTDHTPAMWMVILMEEVGELAEAVLAHQFGSELHGTHSENMRTEAIQAAACLLYTSDAADE